MGTALYVTLEKKDIDQENRSNRIIQLKPHIRIDEAREAVHQVDEMMDCFKCQEPDREIISRLMTNNSKIMQAPGD
jgi:hypothetical protein